MIKSVFKEIVIILLLCVAILLILGVLFYDFIPSNKAIPSKIAYETPENIENEITEEIMESNKTVVTYEITDVDLNVYRQSDSYDPGKKDPFSMQPEEANSQTTNSTQNNGSQGSTGNTNTNLNINTNNDNEEEEVVNTNTNSNSTGTFFEDDGRK